MIRRLDLGFLPALASQAVYHGLAEAMDGDTPDTIIFCAPSEPYFCVGYHQDATRVLDVDLCHRHGWTVLRRRIGGGAVYLDRQQLFYQVIAHRSRAPLAVDRIYARYLEAPVLALQQLGVAARLLPPNDIEVGGRRIAGTGGGYLGEAVVVVGNILFDFPHRRMARAWRAPSRAFRRLAHQGLQRYLTTLRQEVPVAPSRAGLTRLIAAAYAQTLGEPLVPGALTRRERAAVACAEAELGASAFVRAGSGRADTGLKIARGVHVYEGGAPAGGVRVSLRVREGRVDGLAVQGCPGEVARRLLGRPLAALGVPAGANPADAVARHLVNALEVS